MKIINIANFSKEFEYIHTIQLQIFWEKKVYYYKTTCVAFFCKAY